MEEDEKTGDEYYEEDLYQRLGVAKNATTEEIRAAFLRQSRTWHPDKTDPKHREVAERKFKQISEAHKILSDERLRTIYDKLGYKAVTSLSEREITHYVSVEDLIKKYKVKQGKEEELDTSLQIKGRMKIHSDFVDPFTRGLTRKPHMVGAAVEQDFEKRIDKQSALLAGFLFNRFYGNAASGVLYLGYRRMLTADGSSSVYTQILYGDEISVLRLSGSTQLGPNTAGTAIMDFTNQGGNLRLRLYESFGEDLTGNAEYSIGQHNTLSLNLVKTFRQKPSKLKSTVSGNLKFECDYSEQIPLSLPHLELGYSKQFTKWDSFKAEIGTDISVGLDYERKISENLRLGIKAAIKHFQLIVTLKGQYMEQAVQVPIYWPRGLLRDVEVVSMLALPTLGAWFLAHYWLNPLKEIEKRKKVAKIRESTAQIREEKRAEALAEQDLMKYGVEKKIAEETRRKGLVIKKALYGKITEDVLQKLNSGQDVLAGMQQEQTGEKDMEKEKMEENEYLIDVTMPLQHQVEKSELHLLPSSKRTLKGFYDPCPGEKKTLFIEYTFAGILRRVTYPDHDEVRLPSDAHVVKS